MLVSYSFNAPQQKQIMLACGTRLHGEMAGCECWGMTG